MKRTGTFALAALMAGGALAGDIYRCRNAEGSHYFQERPCPTEPGRRLGTKPAARAQPPAQVVDQVRLDRTTDEAKIRIGLQAQEMLKRRLKDPYSAKLGPVVISTLTDGQLTACGLVNSKNSFGAYTGDTPWFYTHGSQPMMPSDMGAEAFKTAFNAHCLK